MSRLFSGLTGKLALAAIGLGSGIFFFKECLYNVPPGYRGVIFNRLGGIDQKVRAEGTHLMIPVLQMPHIMDVRIQPRTIETETGTKDLQMVQLKLRVLVRPVVEKLPQIFQKLGVNYYEQVLPSLTNEVLKQVVAQYDADQLLTLREKVSQNLRDELKERCKLYNIQLEDVSITHLEFGREFAKAIEDKQIAEQMAERAKFVVQKAEQEKQALIIKSEGDAEAAQLVADALAKHGSGLIELRRIETAQNVAEQLSKASHVTYLPSTEKSNLLIGVQGAGGQQHKS
eukprot:TRINITY_DN10330_c0_g1_i1.p1 TRINITY_DN10330_c0_g1~~TRINITY_DN10330_c0_g1_i1.p1  ORF type:complete len:294 (-),score=75.27 TRINITY_DN10330_c0_g1_i1:106-963(-)